VTRLDYVMREVDGGWHVVDVLLDGSISRVAVTRSDFRALLAEGGAARLIASLRAKVADLKAGAAQ
jgi:phospholipid transport system substrate-binding protein